MRKIILSAVAMLAFGYASAQGLHFGAKGGVNFANLTSNYYNDTSFKVGFHVGVIGEYKFNDMFALQPEIVFSQQGAKNDADEYDYTADDGSSVKVTEKVNLSFINVPIMFKYYPIKGLFIEAGPQIGILISAKEKFDKEVPDVSNINLETGDFGTTKDIDVKDSFKSVDLGFNVGLGYDFTQNFFANVRYNIGITNISDVTVDGGDSISVLGVNVNDYNVKNAVLSLSVGYKF